VRPAGGPQSHHPAAQIQVVGLVVDDVGRRQFDPFELVGNGFAQPLEHLQVAGASRRQVLGLVPVDQERGLTREGLGAERVLGVEVRGGQVELASLGVLGGEVQHGFGVARAHAGLHDENGVLAADDADVRHEGHPPVRHDDQVVAEFPDVLDPHDGIRQHEFGHGDFLQKGGCV
jgi:hypothetical protein